MFNVDMITIAVHVLEANPCVLIVYVNVCVKCVDEVCSLSLTALHFIFQSRIMDKQKSRSRKEKVYGLVDVL
jgi:hypothetical protein